MLVLGWGMAAFMQDLLNEMLNGPARLPEGEAQAQDPALLSAFTHTASGKMLTQLVHLPGQHNSRQTCPSLVCSCPITPPAGV